MTDNSFYVTDCIAATCGICYEFKTPCFGQKFDKGILENLFSNSLPTYVQELRQTWNQITETRISGLMPLAAGCPIDKCMINGVWDPELQLAHGGPIPLLLCFKGSRGVPEQWPHQREGNRRWTHSTHGIWKSEKLYDIAQAKGDNEKTQENLISMDWRAGRTDLMQNKATALPSKRFLDDGSARPRGWRPHKKWHRGGIKRRRSANECSFKNPDIVKMLFANINSLTEK